MDDTERSLANAMKEIYRRAKAEAGYNATYFLQMLSEAGPTETARRLINSPRPSEGFTALWERQRLDLTVEAHVLQEPHRALFSDDELERARHRLEEYGYKPPPP